MHAPPENRKILPTTGRRSALITVMGAGILGVRWLFSPVRSIFAMGSTGYPQGIREVRGAVAVNGIAAGPGTAVQPGDTISTGSDGFVIFVVGRAAYMIHENTRLDLPSKPEFGITSDVQNAIQLLSGRMLAVFSRTRRKKMITTTTAVAGIRGSGVYVESEPQRTYICTCYGICDIFTKADPDTHETVKTTYHDAPRFVYAAGAKKLIESAPVYNHTDAELIKLEKYVFRQPPFLKKGGDRGGY